ncbi:hypothetical protein BASA61_005999 [Batrachochytrium salamandrivorans]|nr:hypothetical protein BASA61_005999 [Batrachochytrium salamandrivorans]KAH9272802.1 hypothetical protein BASA83_005006 [Batrachochytrium salamandrivorans]KAJ1340983.1 hypothetical protein BSLG_004456 [Batrachochytrium salamandrivorans]
MLFASPIFVASSVTILSILFSVSNANMLNPSDYPTVDTVPNINPSLVTNLLNGVPNITVNTDFVQVPDWSSDICTCLYNHQWGLTYDDGPGPYTDDLISELAQRNVSATFFVVGSRVMEYPDVLLRAFQAGHEIALHSWSHSAMTMLTNEQIVAEMVFNAMAVKQVIGVTPSLVRPPYGDIDNRVRAILRNLGLTPILWNLDSQDVYGAINVAEQFWMQANYGNASVISLEHDFYAGTEAQATSALDAILAGSGQYTPMPVGRCLGRQSYDEGFWTRLTGGGTQPSTTQPASTTLAASSYGATRPATTTLAASSYGTTRPATTTLAASSYGTTRPATTTLATSSYGTTRPASTTLATSSYGTTRPATTTLAASSYGTTRPATTTLATSSYGTTRPASTTLATSSYGTTRPASTTLATSSYGTTRPASTTLATSSNGASLTASTTLATSSNGASVTASTTLAASSSGASLTASTTLAASSNGASLTASTTLAASSYGTARPASTTLVASSYGTARPASTTLVASSYGTARPASTTLVASSYGTARPVSTTLAASSYGTARPASDSPSQATTSPTATSPDMTSPDTTSFDDTYPTDVYPVDPFGDDQTDYDGQLSIAYPTVLSLPSDGESSHSTSITRPPSYGTASVVSPRKTVPAWTGAAGSASGGTVSVVASFFNIAFGFMALMI